MCFRERRRTGIVFSSGSHLEERVIFLVVLSVRTIGGEFERIFELGSRDLYRNDVLLFLLVVLLPPSQLDLTLLHSFDLFHLIWLVRFLNTRR